MFLIIIQLNFAKDIKFCSILQFTIFYMKYILIQLYSSDYVIK